MADLIERNPEFSDVDELMANLRPQDRDEVLAMTGPDIEKAITDGILDSTRCWAFDYKSRLYMIMGVCKLQEDIGLPWALGTTLINQSPRSLMTIGREYLPKMQSIYPMLVNFVDARNERSIRWLARIGFTIREPVLMGVENRPFHRFDRGFH